MARQYINDNWIFSEKYDDLMLQKDADLSGYAKVRLPHTVKETPFHYFDESEYQMVSGYRREVIADPSWKNKRVFLVIEAAAHKAVVYFNGAEITRHLCGYTAIRVELTKLIKYDEPNYITVRCDSRETLNVPPFGFVVDYMTYGGIYREVYLDIEENTYIEDVYPLAKLDIAGGVGNLITSGEGEKEIATVRFESFIKISDAGNYAVSQSLYDDKGRLVCEYPAGEVEHIAENISLWSPERPVRYILKTVLRESAAPGAVLDFREDPIAFRSIDFRADGFYLNGRKYRIRGLNRHQSYAYVGYAMPASMQIQDALILKNELGCNSVRTSHYPQSHDFIEACDREGLLVFMEFPGWQHIGDDAWKEQALVNLKEMILQYRNHPSIILWGVRINESQDDDKFYTITNEIAHDLDPARPTGGVRAGKKSNLLEDVYTYNDFVCDGKNKGCEPKKKVTSDMSKAYLVSEYNGHMYPTKAYDCEEHRLEHAMRHAKVLDAIYAEPDIAGSFGWCMFDYNTHKDFGSGDRICYHGVLDMFRNPKLASLIYSCEQDETPVLEVSSTMDIGEHPGCNRGDTYIFTNADSVKMYKNDVFISEFTNERSPYKHLNHGPILIDDFIGDQIHRNENFKKKQADIVKEGLNYVALHGYNYPPKIVIKMLWCMLRYRMKSSQAVALYNRYIGDWGGKATSYRFEAIKDGKVVKTIVKKPMTRMKLESKVSHTLLKDSRTYDVAGIRLRMLDEEGNQLFFCNDPVRIETEGPIEIIGPDLIGMQGGMTGLYVKTLGEAGSAKVRITCEQAEPVIIDFTIVKED